MKKSGLLIAGALSSITLSGCATVQSSKFNNVASTGIPYSLATGRLQLTISEDKGQLSVVLGGPIVIPDAENRMVANLPHGAISDNDVTITVDPKTNLLKKVDATSTGKLSQIASAAVKSIAFQNSENSSGAVIFDKIFEPTEDTTDIEEDANSALRGYYTARCINGRASLEQVYQRRIAEAKRKKSKQPIERSATLKQRISDCRSLEEAGLNQNSAPLRLIIGDQEGDRDASSTQAKSDSTKAQIDLEEDCKKGICFRAFKPVPVELSLGDYLAKNNVFLMPDEDSLVAINLRSGVFAEQKYVLTFTDGMLTSYNQNSKNELVGLLSLPSSIVAGVLKAQAEAIGLRKDGIAAETAYLTAAQANTEAQAKAQEACAQKPGACGETTFKLIRLQLNDQPEEEEPEITSGDNSQNADSNGTNFVGG